MYKIFPWKSLLSYSLVIAFCAMLISANLNVILSIPRYDGFNFARLNQNEKVGIISALNIFRPIENLLLRTAIIVSAIFLFATIAAVIENQAENITKLSLLGANKWQIIRFFLGGLLRPWGIAIFGGVMLGTWLSRCIAEIYPAYSGQKVLRDFVPHYHFVCIIYSLCIMFGLISLAILCNVRKLLTINPLSITSGNFKDMSRISWIRVTAGLLIAVYTGWFHRYADMRTEHQAEDNLVTAIILIITSTFLLLPLIFTIILPQIFRFLHNFFPISGIIAQRYFSANSRRYISLSAPIMVCLIFSSAWFLLMNNGKTMTENVISQASLATAVANDIDSHSPCLMKKYLDVQNIGHHALAMPVRQDDRWAEAGNYRNNPTLWAVDPKIFVKEAKNLEITAGDMHNVHGIYIASSRPQDMLGSIVHLITPSGKTLAAHVVVTMRQVYFMDMRFAILVDYKTFPEIDSNLAPYDIYYAGISPRQLRAKGLTVMSNATWLNRFFKTYFQQRDIGNNLFVFPIIAICLALILINSGVISMHSRYMQKVITILGGSQGQHHRIMWVELGAIFSLISGLTYLALMLVGKMMFRFQDTLYGQHNAIAYPYPTMGLVFFSSICAATFLPLIKNTKLYFERIS